MLDLTVVVPTYNRRALLRDAVDSLRRQTHPADRYEILIISDGSTDGTDDDYAAPLSAPLTRLARQEKRGFGLAAARNLGLRHAQGRLVMFFDDDMVADENLVKAHVEAHARFDEHVAICGRVNLAPDLPQTPFCQIVLGDICRLYADNPDRARFLDYGMALSWQTSFKRGELERLGGYDDTFRLYGWEDIEFSYRASQQGMRFWYEPRAIAYHRDQRNTLPRHAERLRDGSRMAPVLFARHPGLKAAIPMYRDKEPIDWLADGLPLALKKMARRFVAWPPALGALVGITPLAERLLPRPLLRRWYYAVLSNYVYLGYRHGLADFAATGQTTPVRQAPGTSRS
jgi:glycosyltransferase involved in cell wall biosynthesis